jgi:protease I
MGGRLDGVRVAVLAMDGFEQAEVTWPLRALRREGADVRVVSLRPGRIRGMNFLWRGGKLAVDDTVDRARPEDYGALLLPGGFIGPDLLRQSERARDFVRGMERLGRPIAVICHGAEVLVSAGLVAGRRLASWPGIADDVRNAGGEWVDAELVRDGRWVSSRGPKDLRAFAAGMIELFEAEAARDLRRVRRRVHWVAGLSRLASLGAAAALALGVRAAWRSARRRGREEAVRRDAAAGGLALAAAALGAGGWMLARRRLLGREAYAPAHGTEAARLREGSRAPEAVTFGPATTP